MKLRNYQSSDVQEIAQLFYDTIHTVNVKDYTQEQVDAWATGHIDLEAWDQSFLDHHSVVVVEDDKIIGFGDMDKTGYLDRLYVHKDHLGRGGSDHDLRCFRSSHQRSIDDTCLYYG